MIIAAPVVTGRILKATVEVSEPLVFLPRFRVRAEREGSVHHADSADTLYLGWLPRGRYALEVRLPGGAAPGATRIRLEAVHRSGLADAVAAETQLEAVLSDPGADRASPLAFSLAPVPPAPALESLSWKRGHADWFFQHFDHASATVVSYMLKDSPLLKGRVLDLGCGDGITALGVALRTGCTELIGIDPFKGYERLPAIVRDNHLPPDAIPANLRFLPEDANALSFPDDHFDVVVSWASVEHFAGGYLRALGEVRRVLKPGGLFFVHPGLYYTSYGHHLGEFSSEPFFHLKKAPEEVERIVLTTPPNRIDRAGEDPSAEQCLQWYHELNRITVPRFEAELRALDFQPWRVALRSEGMVEYAPELERYSMLDLATSELYVACVSRKETR